MFLIFTNHSTLGADNWYCNFHLLMYVVVVSKIHQLNDKWTTQNYHVCECMWGLNMNNFYFYIFGCCTTKLWTIKHHIRYSKCDNENADFNASVCRTTYIPRIHRDILRIENPFQRARERNTCAIVCFIRKFYFLLRFIYWICKNWNLIHWTITQGTRPDG